MLPPPEPPQSPFSESVFVYGTDQTATSTLIVGLALRRQGSFSWADCSVSPEEVSQVPRHLLGRGRTRRPGDGVDRSELNVPSWSEVAIERLLLRESRMDSLNLMSYLALPSLLQELAAMSTAPSGESVVVLTNIDSLDGELRSSVFGNAVAHRRLREERVSLFVTSSASPTREEVRAFDRIFRVDVPDNSSWSDGTIAVVKDHVAGRRPHPLSLRASWQTLGLDPTLLPLA